ncbi:MAG: acyl-CoA/acyl-ACP dehydrogenase [Gaiella sp.]|nr:acyl-CoA/acyl-ACP dehydrogenase [Gaiella sp.]
MNFDFDDDQAALREFGLELAGRTEDAYWQEADLEYRFPQEFWDSLAEAGMLGIALPEEFGGGGKGLLELAIAVEGIAEGGGGMEGGSIFLAGPVFGGCLLDRHGTQAQKEAYLPGLASGQMCAGAFTEPESGSNITAIKTRAELRGDRYVINGQKVFISLVQQSQQIVVMARTQPYDPEHRTRGISLLLGDLPSDAVRTAPFKKLGNRFMDTNRVYFSDYEVPAENIVGEEGNAWGPLYDVLNPERIILGAAAVGTGNLCIRRAVEYAKERSPWGKPIGAYQSLQFPLAQARIHLESARLKVYQAAWLYDQGRDVGVAAAMAKYAAAHAALDAADWAIQVHGGAGYVVDSGIERHWRNLRLYRMSPVSDEMTLNYLAQQDLGLPRSY